MLYTRKGDDGSTNTFCCPARISKGSLAAEAFGTLDECNSFLGFCKAVLKAESEDFRVGRKTVSYIIHEIQQTLFIAQAELAGAPNKKISASKVRSLEKITDAIEKELPPINSFFIPGATKAGALLDAARTVSRRAERRVVEAADAGVLKASKHTFCYLNRISSVLYALARLLNRRAGAREEPPAYK